MRYVAYDRIGGEPNLIVDGSATTGTVMTLSHWPGTPTVAGLERDLSAEMALDLTQPPAEIVSNNHFDQDGLVSVWAAVSPKDAAQRREFLIDLAAAGDFATYRLRDAARVSMAISAYADGDRSPLGPASASYEDWTTLLYTELLGRLAELCDHPERARDLWVEEDATLTASEAALAHTTITEVSELDLSVIEIAEDAPSRGGHRFGGQWVEGLHPMALHNATRGFATLLMCGHHYELRYRYESWVKYRSRRPRPRVDLGVLAEELTSLERGAHWTCGEVSDLTPSLRVEGESALDAATARALVERHLRTAPPAWDPYAEVSTAR